jgi:hypothetical protein
MILLGGRQVHFILPRVMLFLPLDDYFAHIELRDFSVLGWSVLVAHHILMLFKLKILA